MIKAVTFDLWDTIVRDDSDEPKRSDLGLRGKREERRRLVWEALERHQPIAPERVDLAYDVANAAFNRVWHEQRVTWPIAERLGVLLEGLGRALPEDELATLVRAHEEMEIEVRPDLVPDVELALAALHGRYKLAVVSDAIVSPGRALRRLLDSYGLARYFDGFAFSDEVGRAKPHRRMFESAARQLGVALEEMIHVGDRDHNDVEGPQALGMKAVLFTAARDRDREATSADAICARHADLPALIEAIAAA